MNVLCNILHVLSRGIASYFAQNAEMPTHMVCEPLIVKSIRDSIEITYMYTLAQKGEVFSLALLIIYPPS